MTPDSRTLVPPTLVAPPLLLALVCEALAWGLLARSGTLGPGFWYGRGDLLAAVHLVTVGTLALSIVGAGWQLVPVVTARAPGRGWAPLAHLVNLLVVAGLAGLVGGFLWHGPWLAVGGGMLVIGLVLRAVGVFHAFASTDERPVLRAWLAAAELSLLAGVGLGAALVAERAGASILPDRIAGIGLHAGLLLAGWVGGWMLGLAGLLLPMFAVAPEPRPVVMGLAGVGWFAGLALQLPWLQALGGLLAVAALLHSLSRRVRRSLDAGLAGAGLALVVLAGLVLVGARAGLGLPLIAAALTLWALPFLRGVALRIVPFLVWVHGFGELGPRAPTVAALVPTRAAAASVGAGFLAGALVVAGAGTGAWWLAQVGALVGLVGALAALVVHVTALLRALRLRQRALAVPGMEAR